MLAGLSEAKEDTAPKYISLHTFPGSLYTSCSFGAVPTEECFMKNSKSRMALRVSNQENRKTVIYVV